jgi:hypothetical protein
MKHKRYLLIGGVILLLGIAAISFQETQPPGPLTNQEAAVHLAKKVANAWGEPNPQIVSVSKLSRGDFLDLLKAQGDDVALDGSGDVWVVELSGKFAPMRGPATGKKPQYDNMHVVLDVETGYVLNVGSRGPAINAEDLIQP